MPFSRIAGKAENADCMWLFASSDVRDPIRENSDKRLLTEMCEGEAQGSTRDPNQSAVRRVHLQNQQNRAGNR